MKKSKTRQQLLIENRELKARLKEAKKRSDSSSTAEKEKESRLAILNMMEDAVTAKEQIENSNIELKKEITERKKAELQIQKDLKEKTILLTEIHHRVKNSLQLVSSLLRLQSLKITDKDILDLFDQSRNRIFMMAAVYEKLYRTKSFSIIDYKEYLEDVLDNIYQSSGMSGRVSLKLDVQNLVLGLDDAIPASLIINELFSNSIKHAFPGKRKGRIEITFDKLDGETYQLIYRDNGVGLPAGIDFNSTEMLGLNLVKNLARQIEGTATLEQNHWKTFKIIFKGYEYAKKKHSPSRG